MPQAELEQKLSEIAAPVVADLGYALVQVKVSGIGRATNVQVMAEDPATGKLPIDACALISRMLSPVLDVADVISTQYRLEVSSPGIDRPLVTEDDFRRFAGLDTKIETHEPLESGQRRFSGVLQGMTDDGNVTIQTETGDAVIAYSNIAKAKLMLTDALIKATKAGWPPVAETADTDGQAPANDDVQTTTGSNNDEE